jgi:hypothetical protein
MCTPVVITPAVWYVALGVERRLQVPPRLPKHYSYSCSVMYFECVCISHTHSMTPDDLATLGILSACRPHAVRCIALQSKSTRTMAMTAAAAMATMHTATLPPSAAGDTLSI